MRIEPNRKLESSQLIHINSVKYTRLNEICNKELKRYKEPKVLNIFIDLNSILHRFYSNNSCESIDITLTADIINLAGHYCNYFREYGIDYNVHLVYGSYFPIHNTELFPEYNNGKVEKMINDKLTNSIIDEILELVRMTVTYAIPRVHYNRTKFECGVLICELMSRYEDSFNIILTQDQYLYQLVNDNTVILRPFKHVIGGKREDESYFINKYNCIYKYCSERNLKLDKSVLDLNINYGLMSLFLALNGLPCRSIPSKGRAKTNLQLLRKYIDSYDILNKHNIIEPDNAIMLESDIEDLYKRYSAIDIPLQHKHFKYSADFNMITLYNLEDLDSLDKLNDDHFSKNPIIIDAFY